MGLFLSSGGFWFLPVLFSELESRSSFFNRAAGVKRVLSASGLRRIVVQYAGGTSLAKCCFFVRLRAVSSSRPVNRHAKGSLCGVGSGFVPVANRRAPRASRSALTSDGAARAGGACLPTGAKPGWHSAAVFEQPASDRVMVPSAVCPI